MRTSLACAFLVLAAAVVPGRSVDVDDDTKEMMQMLHNNCVGQTGTTEDLIEKARKGVFVDDNRLKCYMKCLFVEVSAMDEDGKIDGETVVALMPDKYKSETERIVNLCKDEPGVDTCDIAFNMHKCTYKANPEMYYLV